MLLTTWTTTQLIEQLAGFYAADQRGEVCLPRLRRALGDDLGCHSEVLEQAWAAWETELALTGQAVGEIGYWLTVGFPEPRPEDS
ncbi:hypothetical protein [Deinococcus sp. Leaf326]|uniref:hypothetical protein n=1 Tax=Deinococcus sp. Leaf326 TaxID=1736338 RepID=UPI00070150B0|nr:hypothetical protein [Deinococcus sp. Leaf326]KQR25534.1 hypothetical protein ASF71_19220 [Deinococcus sp. Leaf326]